MKRWYTQPDTLFDADPEPLPPAPEQDRGLSGEDLRMAVHRYLMRQRQHLTIPELADALGSAAGEVRDQLLDMEGDGEAIDKAHGDRRGGDIVTRWEAT